MWEDHQIRHRDRVPTLTVQCSHIKGTATELRNAVKKQIENIELPPLYSLEWGGEYEENEKRLREKYMQSRNELMKEAEQVNKQSEEIAAEKEAIENKKNDM